MIICNNNSIDIIQGVIGYGNAEGITDWRLENTNAGVFNILNSTSTTPNISIIDNGNVGIGTVPITSSSKLEIIGDVNISGNYRKDNRDIISDTSNYVLSTSNILVNRVSNNQWTNVSSGIYYAPLSNPITSSPAATTTYIIGNYTYMQFTYTTETAGTGTGQSLYTITVPTGGVMCDILIVGGGGGGGTNAGAGGGAGGLILLENTTLSAGTITIKVGNGGDGGTTSTTETVASNGKNTIFGTYTAIGGGAGVNSGGADGNAGGSGGGAGNDGTGNRTGGAGTTGQGFKGGNGTIPGGSERTGGGGGGAGGEGQASVSTTRAGNGGIGRNMVSIFGTSVGQAGWFAGGGGGGVHSGTGGTGGNGGGGSENTEGINGTGGGGGAGRSPNNGKKGGSGVVIIRYLTSTKNVGIGTTYPVTKLHLYDDTINETKLTIQNVSTIITKEIIPSPDANTSGIITNSTDRYMIFKTTGINYYTFTVPTGGINCDILMIGGGGGGSLAGGGAGACIVAVNQKLTANTYNVSVGTGGTGGSSATVGNDSSISVFGGTTRFLAKGGGPGGYNSQVVSGGCGGGGGYNGTTTDVGGSASTTNIINGVSGISPSVTSTYVVFGTNGGTATNNGNSTMAGGGGIGAVGGNYISPALPAGSGGDGLFQATISGTVYNFRTYFANNTTFGVQDGTTGNYFIGGGGGGSCYYQVGSTPGNGGKGGGGKGGDVKTNLAAIAGIVNTGSGGGGSDGSSDVRPYANGGSGIVIIRYRSSSSTSSIELNIGTQNDSNRDYKIINYNGDFIVKSSINGIDADYIKMTGATGAITNPTGTTTWTTTSDRRIKENIERASYDKCYESINKLELNRFNYINGFNTINRDITQLGFIAQEVKEIFPKSVFENSYINNNINLSDLQSIDTTQINYTLYGAVKKLIEIINDNKKNIKKIENTLNIDIDTISTSNNVLIN